MTEPTNAETAESTEADSTDADPTNAESSEPTDADVADPTDAIERRDELVARVREHAGEIARNLARLDGGDYGSTGLTTDAGTWTVKYEAGDLEYLRFEPKAGGETYVVSTKRQPDPDALAGAMEDYPAFVRAYDEHVEGLAGVLDDVDAEFPEVASTASVAAERDRVVERIREVATEMAGELHRAEGGRYGTFAARVDGTRWELNREDGRVSYLRVGGEGGVYLLSEYGPPSVADVRRYADEFGGFVEAYNEHVADLDGEVGNVSL